MLSLASQSRSQSAKIRIHRIMTRSLALYLHTLVNGSDTTSKVGPGPSLTLTQLASLEASIADPVQGDEESVSEMVLGIAGNLRG